MSRTQKAKIGTDWLLVSSRAACAIIFLIGIFLAARLCNAQSSTPNPIPNIFEPHSTPADSIDHLSRFVLIITAVIFLVVFSLLAFAVVKFGKRASDNDREPAQVYGSTQIELAWTVIPVLIVVILFLASARVIHGIQDMPKPSTAVDVTAIGHQFWWEFRYPGLGLVTANELHVPVSEAGTTDAHIFKASIRRYRSQFLGSSACGENRPDSESGERPLARPAPDWNLSGAVRAVLRHAAREDASAGIGRQPGRF